MTAGDVEGYALDSQPCRGTTDALMDRANSTMNPATATRSSRAAAPASTARLTLPVMP